MKNCKVALLQIAPTSTQQGNCEKGMAACYKAKELGAEIAVFPEMWSHGYDLDDIEKAKESALDETSDFVMKFAVLAKELQMAIAITLLEKHQGGVRNAVYVFDCLGKLVLSYAKVHTCDFSEEANLLAGDDFEVADLKIASGNLKVGAMICYDREFPESARILMLKGAELILVPNACPMEINRLSQLRARAFENMVAIATVNYPSSQPDCNGHSSAFDGVAYDRADEPRDTLVFEAGEEEGIFVVDFNMDEIRYYRSREVHGNSYRKPRKYHALIEEKIEQPFVRNDYRK